MAVWIVSLLWQNQVEALCHVGNLLKLHELLPVKRTDRGKAHVFKVADIDNTGIMFILKKLHSLSTDQQSKSTGAN